MKKLLLAIMLLCSITAYSKEYTEVVTVEGKTADQLYSSAREWFAETFKSAQDVLQMDDPVAGKLIGKGMGSGRHKGMVSVPFSYEYQVKVFVKDGRYKYTIENIACVTDGVRTPYEDYEKAYEKFKNKKKKAEFFSNILNTIDSDMTKLIASLETKMNGSEDNW
jgi:hypothetical protein